MIKVTCTVQNYDNPAKEDLKVHSHWHQKEMVELEINGQRYTVLARDVEAAVKNCTNTAGY